MFKYVRSLMDTVLGRKRTLDDENDNDDGNVDIGNKRVKMDSDMVYQVTILNIPTCSNSALKSHFHAKGIPRVKKAPSWNYAVVNFDTKEEADSAIEKINGSLFKGKQLTTKLVEITEENHRARFQNKKGKKGKKNDDVDLSHLTPAERLARQVTPLYSLPYDDQLKKKQSIGESHLLAFKADIQKLKDISKSGQKQIEWANQPGLPCEVLDIIPSPEVDGYRTKCEFTIGKNLDGKPTVGFLLGLFRMGIVNVLEPSELKNIPDIAKEIAKVMEDYVCASEYPVYDREAKDGVWRTIMTKTQRTGDVMILIQIKSEGLGTEKVDDLKKDLVDYWTVRVKDQGINVTTLLFQEWDGVSNGITDRADTQVLYGDGYIYEELLGCRFRVSSSAFFQVNTPGAELMYSKCAEWCNLDNGKKTTLLDICCGTGTIGITMAKSVDKVIGVEMVPEAIVDAKANAERNGITNVTYYANKVEDRLDVFRRVGNEEIVAVLDPPRNGVHASVIRAIREAQHIDKVIFISCDAKQAGPNFTTLCRPQTNRHKGLPFKPVRAVSIDLFPHTNHCELMIEFARVKATDSDSGDEGC